MLRTVALAIGLSAIGLAATSPAGAVDFSCRDATLPAERTICADKRLAGLDETMANIYGRLWSHSSHRSRLELRAAQHRFLSARNECMWNARCIRDAYLDQISVLDGKLVETLEN